MGLRCGRVQRGKPDQALNLASTDIWGHTALRCSEVEGSSSFCADLAQKLRTTRRHWP